MAVNDGPPDDRFTALARALQHQRGVRRTLRRSVEAAVDLVHGCDEACVSLVHRSGRIDTPAATSSTARQGDELQYELQEGPCLDAIWHHETVRSDDLGTEARWPTGCGCRGAARLPFHAVLPALHRQ